MQYGKNKPEKVVVEDTTMNPRRKRGRPVGSKNKIKHIRFNEDHSKDAIVIAKDCLSDMQVVDKPRNQFCIPNNVQDAIKDIARDCLSDMQVASVPQKQRDSPEVINDPSAHVNEMDRLLIEQDIVVDEQEEQCVVPPEDVQSAIENLAGPCLSDMQEFDIEDIEGFSYHIAETILEETDPTIWKVR
jgi:hypothetical protein